MEIGTLCVKIAGRDANQKCVVVNTIDEKYVTIDGNTRRKNVNIAHLHPLGKTLKIKKDAPFTEVKKAMEAEGIEVTKSGKEKVKKTTKKEE